MKPLAMSGSRAITSIVLEIVLLSVLGYFLIGKEIFVPRHPVFSYLVLSVTLVGAFNVLLFRGTKEFLSLTLFVTTVLAVTWFWNRSFAITFRGLGRFWVIALVSAAAAWLLRTSLARAFRLSGTVIWIVLGIVFYAIMIGMDRYLFGIYPAGDASELTMYLLNAVWLGGVLGAGLGIGFDAARYLTPDVPAGPTSEVPPPPTGSV